MHLEARAGREVTEIPVSGAIATDLPGATRAPELLFDGRTVLGTLLLSLVYFADIMWRSSRKPFWFDELFTVYLCRLPSLKSTWIEV